MSAALQAQTKMANVIVTLNIMPSSPTVNLEVLSALIEKEVHNFAGDGEIRIKQEPIAFGLKALKTMFVMQEAKGSTDGLEKKIAGIKGVNSVECTDVRRAIG